jgi:hypothetical protein
MEQLLELQQNINDSLKQVLKNHEAYLTVKGFPIYEVSNFGNIRHKTTKEILKPGVNDKGYRCVNLSLNSKKQKFQLHRLVATTFLNNCDDKECVDHIDGNKLNNNLSNLRFATKQQNNFNRKKISGEMTSRHKGIHFSKEKNKYRAKIRHNGIDIHIGYFLNEDDASRAYNEKAKELFGDFAYLNDI